MYVFYGMVAFNLHISMFDLYGLQYFLVSICMSYQFRSAKDFDLHKILIYTFFDLH